jgi:ferredoxin
MKVTVDPDRCRGHALCLTHAPEGFEFIDIEDRSVVIEGAESRVALEAFETAASECPERAITIDLEAS